MLKNNDLWKMVPTPNPLETEYKKRINAVFQFIDAHLDAELTLDVLAAKAAFSPFHFQRVFKLTIGETPLQYVTRRRIEKAALALLHTTTQIGEIAQHYGFADNAAFTRIFKKFYGVSPTAFKAQHPHRFSKIRQIERKNGQSYPETEKYLSGIVNLKNWITMNATIKVRELPKRDFAYITVIGPQNLDAAFKKIMQWAIPNGVWDTATKMVTIYHNSFKVTPEPKVRMSACILLKQPVTVEGEIGISAIDPGKFIVGSYEIGLEEFEKAWTGLFVWMNENGYQKADRDPFEIYHNNFQEHPDKKAIVDFCIPIQ
ncbi:MAG: GyrI-like domain-containing protein [Bacteroidota bacterium]